MKKSPIVTIVAIGIGAALFFVLGRFVAIPTPIPNTNFSIQYGLLGFMAYVFGPIAGLLIGLIGHTLIDFSYGWGIWWSWVIASGVAGLVMGFAGKIIKGKLSEFNIKNVLIFNATQIIANILAWIVVAPCLDMLIYAEPIEKVFAQGGLSCVMNILTTAVVGTLLLLAYSSTKPKKGSLSEAAPVDATGETANNVSDSTDSTEN